MRPHPDVDLLALHALGEPVLDGPALEHLSACPGCAASVAGLTRTVRTVRGPATHDVRAVPVPAHVWQAIAAELGLDPAVRPASVGPSRLRSASEPDPRPGTVEAVAAPADVVEAPADVVEAPADLVEAPADLVAAPVALAAYRRPPLGRRAVGVRVFAVAAAGLAVGAAGTALVVPRLTGPDVPAPAVLAAADLEAFGAGEGTDVTGSARLAVVGPAQVGADDRVLRVWLDDMPDSGDGFFEAWLIDPDTGAMVSLGPVRTDVPGAAAAELTVPRNLDVGAYAVVDVSAEPFDGNPAHSGVSLVRGTLDT